MTSTILLDTRLVVDPQFRTVLLILLAIALGLGLVYLIRIHIAYRMAKNRHRDPVGWVLLSFFVSPLLVWIVLLIEGDDGDNQQKTSIDEQPRG